MAEESRTKKSIRNIWVGFVGLALSLVVQFISRTVFIRTLGAEYNGVNGLFTNILNILSLAELGFAFSVAYILYKPLKECDERTISAIMNFFAKVYRIIAVVVLAAGLAVIPFLQYLIAEDVSELAFNLNQLRIYFAFYLANTVSSYLLAYKRTIITADQNSYIVSLVDNFGTIALYVVQTVLLLIFKNYYAYLVTMVAKTVLSNVIITIIADKKYPYLRKYRKLRIEKSLRSDIIKNVEASFCHRVGTVIIFGTTTVIISAFVSLIDAGKYSNYMLIVSGVNTFINLIFNSVTASVGNLCVGRDDYAKYAVYKRINYLANFLAVFAFTCYLCLFNPFMEIWVGENLTLDSGATVPSVFPLVVVAAISAESLFSILRKPVNTFKDAQGLFKRDWYKPILEAAAGIGLAIGLSYVWGTFGVITGYMLATVVIAIPIEKAVLFRHGMEGYSIKSRMVRGRLKTTIVNRWLIADVFYFIGTVIFAVAVGAASYIVCSYMPSGIGGFVLKALFSIIFSAGVFVLATFRTDEFRYYLSLVKRLCRKIFRRKT